MPVDSEFPDLEVERLSGYAQFRSSAGGARDQALSLAQCVFNHHFLPFRKVRDQGNGRRSRIRSRRHEPAWIDTEDFPVAKDYGPLDYILQFANVTGPVIVLE